MHLKDPKLSKAFADKLASFKDKRSPKDILLKIARTSGWNPEDITVLTKISTDEYYNLFKETKGDELRVIVSQGLKFASFRDSDTNMQAISTNVEEALKRIAKESALNKERVRSYGIVLE